MVIRILRRRKAAHPQLRARIERRILAQVTLADRHVHTHEEVAAGLTDAVMRELGRLTGEHEGADFAMILGYELGLEEAGRDMEALIDSTKERRP